MSTKSLALGNLWGGLPLVRSVLKEESRKSPLVVRRGSAVTLPRMQAKSKRSFGLSLSGAKSWLSALLVVATAGMLLAYVFGINQSAAKGYEIKKQQSKLNQLVEQNKKLMVRAAEMGSIVQIQNEAEANQLVQITNQEYLQVNQLTQR
jgi:hypothetical protein